MVTLYILLGIVAILCYFAIRKKRSVTGKPIPGPGGWPVVGKGFEITPETLHSKVSEYAKHYGDIFQIKVFNDTLVCLNSADFIRKAFNNDPYKKVMNDRSLTFWGKNILYDSQSIGFYPQAFGGIHGDLRKGVTRAMHVYGDGVKDFEERIVRELRRLHKVLDAKEGEDVDFVAVLKRSLTNVVAYLLSGEDIEDGDKDVGLFWQLDYTNEFMLNANTNTILLTFPFLTKLPGYYKQMYNDCVDAKQRIIERYFNKIRKTHQPGVIRGVVDFLLDEQAREVESGKEVVFTDERLINTVMETIAAGVITTFSSASNTILCLVNNPEYQERVYKELNTVIGPDRMPTLDDKANCPLLEAITTESLRLIPIVPLLLAHRCSKDINFEGYHVPAGSSIIPNVWYVQHDEAIWGDPWTFRPERWLDESGHVLPSTDPLRKHWIVFGTGRRQCVGEQFARSRLFLYLASLLKTYKFTATPGKCGPCDPRKGDFDITLVMRAKPYHVNITRRS